MERDGGMSIVEEIRGVYDRGPEAVVELVLGLAEQIAILQAQVKELEDRLATNSRNSSKPPSTDPPGSKPSPKSLRQPSGRKPGGQPGHPGKTLKMAQRPDRVVVHAPERCRACGEDLAAVLGEVIECAQVIDLVPRLVETVEHQAQSRRCACGETMRGQLPEGVLPGVAQYGPGLKGLGVYLNQAQLIPAERTSAVMAEVFGCESYSVGTLDNSVEECHQALGPVEEEIKTGIVNSAVAHFDETGLNIDGKLNWLHVACTELLTHYGWHPRRGRAAMDEVGILPKFKGQAVHDDLESYYGYDCPHVACNVHHARELIYLEERLGQPWAAEMRDLLFEMKGAVDKAKESGASQLPPDKEQTFEDQYTQILAEGFAANPPPERPPGTRGRPKRGKALALLDRLKGRREAVLRFMHDFTVPFDNNQAERDLRMAKVKGKISGCFRADNGATRFCRIRGYISTIRKHGKPVFGCLRGVFSNQVFSPVMPAPTLAAAGAE